LRQFHVKIKQEPRTFQRFLRPLGTKIGCPICSYDLRDQKE